MSDARDLALLLLIGIGLSVGEVAVRQHRDKQPRTLYLTVRINPLEVVSGEVNLPALTRDGLDTASGYAKAVGLPPLCWETLKLPQNNKELSHPKQGIGMSQTTSSTMSKGPHLCLKNMLSKTDIVQLKALAVNKLSIRHFGGTLRLHPT